MPFNAVASGKERSKRLRKTSVCFGLLVDLILGIVGDPSGLDDIE
jgi:hypothetical protein